MFDRIFLLAMRIVFTTVAVNVIAPQLNFIDRVIASVLLALMASLK